MKTWKTEKKDWGARINKIPSRYTIKRKLKSKTFAHSIENPQHEFPNLVNYPTLWKLKMD